MIALVPITHLRIFLSFDLELDANCDNVEQIRLEKQQKLENFVVSEAKIKRTDQEKTPKVPKSTKVS